MKNLIRGFGCILCNRKLLKESECLFGCTLYNQNSSKPSFSWISQETIARNTIEGKIRLFEVDSIVESAIEG